VDEGLFSRIDTLTPPSVHDDGFRVELPAHREPQFEALFRAAPDAILIVDRSGRIVLANEQAERVFGYQREELLGESVELLVPERYRALHVVERNGYTRQPRTRPMGSGLELTGRRKDGTEVAVEISLSPVDTDSGQQVIAVIRDVTERREVERALAERTRLLEQQAELLDLADNAILVVGWPDRKIEFWNHGAEVLYGWTKQEALGRQVHELLKTEFPQPIGEVEKHLESEGIWRGELIHTSKDGRRVTVESRWSARRDDEWRMVAFLELNTDVTARKRAELELRETADELARSNAELEQFTYVASHDLQEPLRMVASYSQLLARRYRGRLDEDADEFINYAVTGAQRMQALIEDLLSYARVGSRGRPFEAVDCRALVDTTLKDMRDRLEDASATVAVGDLPTVHGDPVQLAQLFQNVISNALKYRGELSPRIEITADRRGNEWQFAIRDNGIGIAPEYSDQIFVMFKRLHPRERYEGTGIGLAICKKIVARHGGHIWVESEAGKGSTFLFTLPIASGAKS
jgi:PAS domain S-box-containing protein